MTTRRSFITSMMAGAASILFPHTSSISATALKENYWHMPDEGEPHQRTWMAFGASRKIWGRKLLPEVQQNLATIALTIARYEPVSMLVRPSERTRAKQLMGSDIELISCPLDDLWMRDTGPVFVKGINGKKAGIDFNFNGWGEKQDFYQDAEVAAFVAQYSKVQRISSNLILEGGGIEVDGQGTAIITKSCVLNNNRNPGLTKSECEHELKRLLGLKKIIWLPGIKGKDITDGHTDFYARFTEPGVVVAGFDPDPSSFDHHVTKQHLKILRSAKDAAGRQLEVIVLQAPSQLRGRFPQNNFAAGYINFYVCNGAVIAPEFGDPQTDKAALHKLQSLFPKCEIIQLNIDGIAAGGGGIHCTTQQEPKTTPSSFHLD